MPLGNTCVLVAVCTVSTPCGTDASTRPAHAHAHLDAALARQPEALHGGRCAGALKRNAKDIDDELTEEDKQNLMKVRCVAPRYGFLRAVGCQQPQLCITDNECSLRRRLGSVLWPSSPSASSPLWRRSMISEIGVDRQHVGLALSYPVRISHIWHSSATCLSSNRVVLVQE